MQNYNETKDTVIIECHNSFKIVREAIQRLNVAEVFVSKLL